MIYMVKPLVNEDQCSHMFFSEIVRLYGILPLRVHGTAIEVTEGVDAVYIMNRLEDLQKRPSKLLLVQEKAAYRPPYSFILKKRQHDTMLNRQSLFTDRAYLYGFFCVKDFYELFQIFMRTIFVEANRIPQFATVTKTIQGFLPTFSVRGPNYRRVGYPFTEILRRLIKCYIGLPNKHFRLLTEDLFLLLKERIPFHLLTYDIERNITEIISPRRLEKEHTDESYHI